MRRRNCQPGFTLLELVLVMLIVTVAMGLAAPSLRGWSAGTALTGSAEDMYMLTRLARTQAITNGVIYRIKFQSQDGKFQLMMQKGTQFVAVPGGFGKVYTVPPEGRLELTVTTDPNAPQDTLECINFFPTGRTQTSVVKITDKTGAMMQIKCDSPAEDFYVVKGKN